MSSRNWRVSYEQLVTPRYYPPTTDKLTVLNRDIEYYRASNDSEEKELGLTAIKGAIEYAADCAPQDDTLTLREKQLYPQLYSQPLERIQGLLETVDATVFDKKI